MSCTVISCREGVKTVEANRKERVGNPYFQTSKFLRLRGEKKNAKRDIFVWEIFPQQILQTHTMHRELFRALRHEFHASESKCAPKRAQNVNGSIGLFRTERRN